MLIVVAICGARRVGKDTVADYLCAQHGFSKASFAAPLKDMVRAAFGFSQLQVDGALKDTIDPVHGITPRQALQFMGTEIMQYEIKRLMPDLSRTFWVDRLVRDWIVSCDAPSNRIVVSDMRFLHEHRNLAEAVQRAGGVYQAWCVTRLKTCPAEAGAEAKAEAGAEAGVDAHASEQDFKAISADVQLINDFDLAGLYRDVERALRRVLDELA